MMIEFVFNGMVFILLGRAVSAHPRPRHRSTRTRRATRKWDARIGYIAGRRRWRCTRYASWVWLLVAGSPSAAAQRGGMASPTRCRAATVAVTTVAGARGGDARRRAVAARLH